MPWTFFILEILVGMNTAFYEEGFIELSHSLIIYQYLKTDFVIDILSIISLQIYHLNPSYELILLLLMLKIFKIAQYKKAIDEHF